MLRVFHHVQDQNRPNSRLIRELGLQHFIDGSYLDAIETLNELSLKERDSETYLCLANAYACIGDFNSALENCSYAAISDDKFSEAFLQWGRIHAKNNDYEKAAKMLKVSTERDKRNIEAWFHLGNAYVRLGKYTEAKLSYENVIMLDSSCNVGVYNNLGNVLVQTRDYTNALEQYYKAISMDANFSEAYKNWEKCFGLMKANQGRNKTLKVNAKYCYVYYSWGNLLSANRNYLEAIDKYEKAAQINPEFLYIYINWNYALRELGDVESADKILQKVKQDKSFGESGYIDALIYQTANQLATQTTEEVLEREDDKTQQLHRQLTELAEEVHQVKTESRLFAVSAEGFDQDKKKAREELDKIESRNELSEYYGFMLEGFSTVIATAYVVNGNRFQEKNDELQSFLAWITGLIPNVGPYLAWLFSKVSERQIEKVNQKYVQCLSYFRTVGEAEQVTQYVARKLTLKREAQLINDYNTPLMKGNKTPKNAQAKTFINEKKIKTKSEELAFKDLSVMLLECFFADLEIKKTGNKIANVASAVLDKMLLLINSKDDIQTLAK